MVPVNVGKYTINIDAMAWVYKSLYFPRVSETTPKPHWGIPGNRNRGWPDRDMFHGRIQELKV